MGAVKKDDSFLQEQPSNNNLQDTFATTTKYVRDFAARFEQKYCQPALKYSWTMFEERPVLAIFSAIFLSLSVIPIVSFLGISIFIIASFLTVALGCAFIAISAALVALSAILLSSLLVTLLTSSFLTMVVISSYMLFRLLALLRQDGPSGISGWAGETKQHFLNTTNRGRNKDYVSASDNEPSTPVSSAIEHTKTKD